MKPRTGLILAMIVVFVAAVGYALWREFIREEAELSTSLSGLVEVHSALYASGRADVVRTDRLVLVLVDPTTMAPVAMKFITPLVPPQTFTIGAADVRGNQKLEGKYILIGISDKDGEIFQVTRGEVYGRSAEPLALGSERLRLVLDQPFRGTLFNDERPVAVAPPSAPRPSGDNPPPAEGPRNPMPREARSLGAAPENPALAIQGVIRVAPELAGGVGQGDRLVILLFDPETGRPATSKIIPHFFPPQGFSIGFGPEAAGKVKKAYGLRILTDKDRNPVNAVPGEVIGRSKAPIPLGTHDLEFVLDQPYKR